MSWISVDDELPPPARHWDGQDSIWYLVCDKWGGMYTASLDQWDGDETPFWCQFGRDGYRMEGVTHWQKLPAPPE